MKNATHSSGTRYEARGSRFRAGLRSYDNTEDTKNRYMHGGINITLHK